MDMAKQDDIECDWIVNVMRENFYMLLFDLDDCMSIVFYVGWREATKTNLHSLF